MGSVNTIIKLFEAGNYQGVIDHVLGQDLAKDHKALFFLGLSFRRLERIDESLTSLEEAHIFAPQDANIVSELGVTYYHKGDKIKALEMMNLAVKIEPENPYRYSSRAYIFGAMRRIDDAVADYKKAIELDPEDAVAHNNLGLLEEQQGRKKSAEQYFKKSDQLGGRQITDEELEKLREESVARAKEVEQPKEQEENALITPSKSSIIKGIFTDKKIRQEFLTFIKNGFKTK